MIIFIVGHSCAGKTTFGKEYAKDFNFHFIDLDQYIEKYEGVLLYEIYKEKGEEHFRNLETKYLKQFVNQNKHTNIVISVGGGTPCHHNNMEFMNKHGYTIYLKTNYDSIIERAIKHKKKRFLLRDKNDDEIKLLYNKIKKEREKFYNMSHFIKVN